MEVSNVMLNKISKKSYMNAMKYYKNKNLVYELRTLLIKFCDCEVNICVFLSKNEWDNAQYFSILLNDILTEIKTVTKRVKINFTNEINLLKNKIDFFNKLISFVKSKDGNELGQGQWYYS